jgi:hypothetical protein
VIGPRDELLQQVIIDPVLVVPGIRAPPTREIGKLARRGSSADWSNADNVPFERKSVAVSKRDKPKTTVRIKAIIIWEST